MFRMISMAATFLIVAYMVMLVLGSDDKIDDHINQNETVQSNKAALKSAGINADDKKSLEKAVKAQAAKLQAYQNQAQVE